MSIKRRVSYFYDGDVGNFYYGQGHPMKPHRIRMTNSLLVAYGVYQKLDVFRPDPATFESLTMFHSDSYINFLRDIRPDNISNYENAMQNFNVGEDCPVFDGLYEFCKISSGGSIAAASKINLQESDIAINWMGGLHHAKKCEASGFCYTNDIVLAILELLNYHKRVLYVDIDIHHGDGVEEAFYTTDRVMTVSFHKYGEYFPGTGDLKDVGAGSGRYYALNFPLRDGIDDMTYESIFAPVMGKVMEYFRPDVVVLQCGADSLTGDRLGCFNLTVRGHGRCLEFLKKYDVPIMMLGGGGYTIRNVARCWTYETSVALNVELSNHLPYNQYVDYYGPDFQLHITPSNMPNMNTRDYLEKVKVEIYESLRQLDPAPGVQMQQVPSVRMDKTAAIDAANPDERLPTAITDGMIADNGEFYDEEKEGGDLKNRNSFKRTGSPMETDDAKRNKS
ncbi:hypothetical protein M3Y94_00484800 [Aphelenchoides besseyi]|nr:hypothetical protein M3Y94_00484800 [Aphelenchoides besseyi]KAI6217414.1 hypothetical protein M3Y95_01216600 [Aphelenchoides besseyi]